MPWWLGIAYEDRMGTFSGPGSVARRSWCHPRRSRSTTSAGIDLSWVGDLRNGQALCVPITLCRSETTMAEMHYAPHNILSPGKVLRTAAPGTRCGATPGQSEHVYAAVRTSDGLTRMALLFSSPGSSQRAGWQATPERRKCLVTR
jgi:hypothetical protein